MYTTIMASICRQIMLAFIILTICYQRSLALTCWDNTSGEMKAVSNDEWNFCALVPATADSEGQVFGLGAASDDVAPYMLAFSDDTPGYRVLSMCIYEKYDFAKVLRKPMPIQFFFRCVCNYDKCNQLATFDNYLTNLAR